MLAKLTAENQLFLPEAIVEKVRADYYSVRIAGQSIILTPVEHSGLEAAQEKLAQLGINAKDIPKAVAWARKQKREAGAK